MVVSLAIASGHSRFARLLFFNSSTQCFNLKKLCRPSTTKQETYILLSKTEMNLRISSIHLEIMLQLSSAPYLYITMNNYNLRCQ